MQHYRERVPDIVAWRYDLDVPMAERPAWVLEAFAAGRVTNHYPGMLRIGKADFGRPGDWLVRVNDTMSFWPDEQFVKAYEPVEG